MLYSESPSPSYDVEVDSLQLFSSRCSHNQLDARSGVWLSLWIVLRLSLPVVSIAAISWHTDWEQNFPTPTSMGKSHVCHPLLLHSLRRSVYLAFFFSYASSLVLGCPAPRKCLSGTNPLASDSGQSHNVLVLECTLHLAQSL